MTPGRKQWVIVAAALIAALLVFYAPALKGGFLWDDDAYISGDRALRSLAGLRAIWLDPSATCQYYPLSFTFFWAIYQVCGLNPLGFHLVTLLLHGVAAILFWRLLVRLRVRGALLAAAIFALHPVNVMSVAWMSELKNTLSGSLGLGAALAYAEYFDISVYDRARSAENRLRWYGLSLVLFLFAMLAKTAVSFLPATLLLIVWWQRGRITRRDVLPLLPMLGIAVGMGALTIYVERHAGGAAGRDFNLGLADRVLVSGRSFWFYLGKLVWPYQLTFIYPRWRVDAGEWWQWIYPGATVGLLAGTWLARGRIGKGPFVALMHFYVSTSMLILAVVLYMMRYSFVSDHWVYFGSFGIIALAASGLARAADWMGIRRKEWAGIALVLGLGVLTWRQSGTYRDLETLWRRTIARNPECWMARDNLGGLLLAQGRTEEAMAQYTEALRVNPPAAEAYRAYGNALVEQGRLAAGIDQYQEALRIDPGDADAYNSYGNALLELGRTDDAIAQYREAVKLRPGFAAFQNNLDVALLPGGQAAAAFARYRDRAASPHDN